MPFQPFDKGYDVEAIKRPGPEGANGFLTFRGQQKKLWVYEVQTGFQMSGSTGQSFRTRSFFPHNFVQPAFTIMCQFPNQELYGEVVEFIRYTQTTFDSSLRMEIVPGFVKALPEHNNQMNRRLKGVHSALSAEGYVKTVPRQHEAHTYAPELQFDFIVERMLSGLGSDEPVKIRQLKNWNQIVEDQQAPGFIEDPDDQSDSTSARVTPGANGQLRPN